MTRRTAAWLSTIKSFTALHSVNEPAKFAGPLRTIRLFQRGKKRGDHTTCLCEATLYGRVGPHAGASLQRRLVLKSEPEQSVGSAKAQLLADSSPAVLHRAIVNAQLVGDLLTGFVGCD